MSVVRGMTGRLNDINILVRPSKYFNIDVTIDFNSTILGV